MNSELNRTAVGLQYFELRIALNRANRIKNLSTTLEFELRENDSEHFIIIKSTSAENGLCVAIRKTNRKFWELSKIEIYEEFYEYLFYKIRTLTPGDDMNINFILTDWLSRLWVI